MKPQLKLVAYGLGLALAFGAAFGVGSLTGSPAGAEPEPGHGDGSADQTDHSGGDDPAGSDDHGTPANDPATGPELTGLAVSAAGYTLSPVAAPAATGEAGTLSFDILGPDGQPVTDFTESHERDLHLIIVRSDTAEFHHVHPARDAGGRWSIEWQWDHAGTYKVLADFTPTALGEGLTLAQWVTVGGEHNPAPPPAIATTAQVAGYTVTLTGELVAGQPAVLTATITRAGQPVTTLQPYLGAYGHLVALRQGDLGYVHVHPEHGPAGAQVAFALTPPTAGDYRLFFEFQTGDQVHLAEFTMTAA